MPVMEFDNKTVLVRKGKKRKENCWDLGIWTAI